MTISVKEKLISDSVSLEEVIQALNFPVELRRVDFLDDNFPSPDKGGQYFHVEIPECRAVIRAPFQKRNYKGLLVQGNRFLGMVSSHYKMYKHGDVMQTNLEQLKNQGWKIAAYKLDEDGAKAYVVMILPLREKVYEALGVSTLYPRLIMKNAYDGTSKLKLSTGLFESERSAYLIHPFCQTEIGIRHYGNHEAQIKAWPNIYKKIEQLMPQFQKSIEAFKVWTNKQVGSVQAQQIAERVAGKRKMEMVLSPWANAGKTAWALYSAGAQYLTLHFKGQFSQSERRNWILYEDIQTVLEGKPLNIKEKEEE